MITVNSISGGKTSAYLYANYPSNYNLFALVCNNDPKCANKDKLLMQMANDKLQKYSSRWGEFIGTPEDPSIIKTVFDLEQKFGHEIIWLRGISFDDLCDIKNAIPNQFKRFCTTEMKMQPIFEFCHLRIGEKVKMRVGFRYDEKERANRFSETIKHTYRCDIGDNRNIHRWKETDWRVGDFVLIDDKVTHFEVFNWSEETGIYFAPDSNCQNCFWKHEQQLRKNFETNPDQMNWAKSLEQRKKRTFKKGMSMAQIETIGIQQDFNFGTGSGCQAGSCTD